MGQSTPNSEGSPAGRHVIRVREYFITAIILAVVARCAFWCLAIAFPIPNEVGIGVSPTIAYSAIDLEFYLDARDVYATLITWLLSGGSANVELLGPTVRPFMAGPILPLMMVLFDYRPGNAVPLSAAYLVIGIGWTIFWLTWMRRRHLSTAYLYVFALLPLPYWFMVNISSDLPFAVIVAVFYWLFFDSRLLGRWRWSLLLMAAIVAVGTRPNGLSLLVFLGLALALRPGSERKLASFALVAGLAVVSVVILQFYSGYLQGFLESSSGLTYFGYSQTEYLEGIYADLPDWLDRPLSWSSLLVAKLLYLVGLRESYGSTPLHFVLLRASAGLFLLPGLIRWLVHGAGHERLFLLCYLAPILLGAAQERYVLAISPIMFHHGVGFYGWIIATARVRLGKTRDPTPTD
jgi:hypothetical protein